MEPNSVLYTCFIPLDGFHGNESSIWTTNGRISNKSND